MEQIQKFIAQNYKDFAAFKAAICHEFDALDTPIKIAQSEFDVNRVVAYICSAYETSFPGLAPNESDDYIINSFNCYIEDENGDVNGTISLVVDSERGFPEENLLKGDIQHYRDDGQLTFELGRFVVTGKSKAAKRAMCLLQVLYLLPKLMGGSVVFGMLRPKDKSLHVNRFGATILNHNTGETYGSEHDFATVAWELDMLKSQYFEKTGCPKIEGLIKPIYQQKEWNKYAAAFGSVQTTFQRELQMTTMTLLKGDVADFGCGTAKLAPLLCDSKEVRSYTGIDYSKTMIEFANELMSSLDCPALTTWEGKIEDYTDKVFDSALSLNSFYSWPDPGKILTHIATLLKPGGRLVLATPNKRIKAQMPKMLKEAEKELLLHPHWSAFKQQNLDFVDNPDAHFIDMDDLVDLAQSTGFAIQSCHQMFYLGALNFLVLTRKSQHRLAA